MHHRDGANETTTMTNRWKDNMLCGSEGAPKKNLESRTVLVKV
jgi:hypothetical protein